jgi:pimeloyl-ACP methyl ester carboxylesterase
MEHQTILMIHGMQGGGWQWENFKCFFEEKGYVCITPNLKYHARGEPHPMLGTVSIKDYLDDLEVLLGSLPENTILMGHSMGGLLALLLSAKGYGGQTVLFTPATPSGIWSITPTVLKGFFSSFLRWKFWRKPFKQTFKEAHHTVLKGLSDEDARMFYDYFSYESGQALFEIGLWFLDKKKTTRVDKKSLTHPILTIGGVKDNAIPIKSTRKMVQQYEMTYWEYPEHSHAILGEKGWDAIAWRIQKWLTT